MSELLVLATRPYGYLRDAVCAAGHFRAGDVQVSQFPDGERYQRVLAPVAGRDVVVLGGTISDEATCELYDLCCGVLAQGARGLSVVIPYFGYSTMERAVVAGEIVTAKARARLLSSLPPAADGNRVILFDVHSEGLPYYFEGGLRPVHVYGKALVAQAARRLGGADFVLACTDAGRAKWVQSLANDLDVPASFVFKRRLDGAETRITAVSAQVAGKVVVIYDDMIRTGGSLLQAAAAYRDAGATLVEAVATHGVLPGDARDRLRASGLLAHVVCTDSHPRARTLADDFLEVVSCAPILAAYLGGEP